MKKTTILIFALCLSMASISTIKAQSTNPSSFIVHGKTEVRASMAYMLNAVPQSNLKLKVVNANNQVAKEFTIAAGSQTVNKVDINVLPTGNYSVELYDSQNVLIHRELDVKIIRN